MLLRAGLYSPYRVVLYYHTPKPHAQLIDNALLMNQVKISKKYDHLRWPEGNFGPDMRSSSHIHMEAAVEPHLLDWFFPGISLEAPRTITGQKRRASRIRRPLTKVPLVLFRS